MIERYKKANFDKEPRMFKTIANSEVYGMRPSKLVLDMEES